MRKILILACCAIGLSACGGAPNPEQAQETSYPAPNTNAAYQAPLADNSYPAPEYKQGPAFSLNAPTSGATEVTGKGPANVPVRLVDISAYGEPIGEAKIDADGTFRIPVAADKIIKGNQLAIQIGDLNGTNINPDDFRSGPGYEDLPFVGTVLSWTIVK